MVSLLVVAITVGATRVLRVRVVRWGLGHRKWDTGGTVLSGSSTGTGVVLIEISGGLVVTASGSTKRIEFGGSDHFRVGLDEGSTVVTHWLVAGIWVLGNQGVDGGDKDQNQKNKGEDGVHDKEDNSQDTAGESWFLKDSGEDHQEDRVDEVDDADGDVEDIDLAIHPWSEVSNGDKVNAFDKDESDALNGPLGLGEGNEDALDEDVSKHWDDPVVARTLELHIEETPSIERSWVGVKNHDWALVHVDGVLSEADDLVRGPRKKGEGDEEENNGENNGSWGVTDGQFPQTEDGQLREANENNAVENSLEDNLPPLPELSELGSLCEVEFLDAELKTKLKSDNDQDNEDDESDKESKASHEDICLFNSGKEGDTRDTSDINEFTLAVSSLVTAALDDNVLDGFDGSHSTLTEFNSTLHDLNVDSVEVLEQKIWLTTGGLDVPVEDVLHETDTDDTHTPNEILGPRSDNWWKFDGDHGTDGLRLEVSEKGESIGSNMGSGVGVTQSRGDGRGCKTGSGNNSGDPANSVLMNSLAVRKLSLETSDRPHVFSKIDGDSGKTIDIRDCESNTGNRADEAAGIDGRWRQGNWTSSHGAQTSELFGTRIDLLCVSGVAVDDDFHDNVDISFNR